MTAGSRSRLDEDRGSGHGELERYQRLVAWARSRLALLEAKAEPAEIDRHLEKGDLFPRQ